MTLASISNLFRSECKLILYLTTVCLSCNIKRSKTSAKLSENNRNMHRSDRIQWCHMWRPRSYCYRFCLSLFVNRKLIWHPLLVLKITHNVLMCYVAPYWLVTWIMDKCITCGISYCFYAIWIIGYNTIWHRKQIQMSNINNLTKLIFIIFLFSFGEICCISVF
jgi:hypothetical protein